jgi:hypothetical protein
MEAGVAYTFNLVNLQKSTSSFQTGNVPVMFSLAAHRASGGAVGWTRASSVTNASYFRNIYRAEHGAAITGGNSDGEGDDDSDAEVGGVGEHLKCNHSLRLTLTFSHANDVVWLAHLYPYSLSFHREHIEALRALPHAADVLRAQLLCLSRGGNAVELLTITNFPPALLANDAKASHAAVETVRARPVVVITSRVHPGETSASWVLKGFLDFITSTAPAAHSLRERLVFKIVPILNPDGVVEGTYRCSLAGADLNRCWEQPCPARHPSLFWTKQLVMGLARSRDVRFYLDLHGHSAMHSAATYGCALNQCDADAVPCLDVLASRRLPHSGDLQALLRAAKETGLARKASGTAAVTLDPQAPETLFPLLLAQRAQDMFSYPQCTFSLKSKKAGSARAVFWRALGLSSCFTLESTFCSVDGPRNPSASGMLRGVLLQPRHYELLGVHLAGALQDWLEKSERVYHN